MPAGQPIIQSSTVTPGHVGVWTTDGVLQDGGPATEGAASAVGITANGGISFAISSANPPNAYVQYGVGVSSTGIITIYANSFGGAPAATLEYNINGVTYAFNPSLTGNVTGPISSVNGDLAAFNGTNGNLIEDSGINVSTLGAVVSGPASAVSTDIATFNGTTGKLIEDSGVAIATVTAGLSALFPPVANVATLESETSASLTQTHCYLLGYFAANDGGEGVFYVGATTTANGGTIINDASGRSWYRETGNAPYSIAWFGATTGASDNTAPIGACIAATNGTMYVPPGVFKFSTQHNIPTKFAVTGAGRGISVLQGTTASMGMFTCNLSSPTETQISFRDVGFDGGAAGITAFGATFCADVQVRTCLFTGIAYPVSLDRCYAPKLTDLIIRGNASHAGGQILVENTAGGGNGYSSQGIIEKVYHDCSATFGVGGSQTTPLILLSETENTNVRDCFGYGLSTISANTINHIEVYGLSQGLVITGNQSIGAAVGILVNVGASAPDAPAYITLTDNLIDSFGTGGIIINGASFTGSMNLIQITGGSITAPEGSTVPCIGLYSCGFGVTISSVRCYQYLNFPTASGYGIQIGGCQFVSVIDSFFGQLTAGIQFEGTNDHITITENDFLGNTADLLSNSSGNNVYGPNQWSVLPTVSLPTLPASGTPYANVTGLTLLIAITGGAVSTIDVNTISTGLTSGAFVLPPTGHNAITVVYSGSPTWAATVLW